MGHLFVFLAFGCALISLAYPWIGVVYAYLFVVLAPQDVWFWAFEGVRAVLLVLVPTSVGVILGIFRRQFDFSTLRGYRNLFMLGLWICFISSYFFGPYAAVSGPFRFDDAATALDRLDKMLFLYFVACLCIDTERKAKVLFFVFAVSAVYLTYWINEQYLTGHRGQFGRMSGPTGVEGTGIYADENDFAMLFVIAQPFLWYLGMSFGNRLKRLACWLPLPFLWHAVFLTGSRGGLIGLAATLLLICLRSRRARVGFVLIPALAAAFLWQGGSVMKDRADSIQNYSADASAVGRLDSWKAAMQMMAAHPLTGVGLASFGPAYPDYSDKKPRETHNTLLQIAAESGVLAGALYALIVATCIVPLWRNGNDMMRAGGAPYSNTLFMLNEATLIGFCGLVVCSLFLSLQQFEIFYCLNVLANAVLYLSRRKSSATVPALEIAGVPGVS